jgi:hypothetical protein
MEEFSVSRTTIFRACHSNSKPSKLRGCPHTITSPYIRGLLAQACKTPTKSARALGDLVGILCSTCTIQRELKWNDYVQVCIKKVPWVSQATDMLPKEFHLQKNIFQKENNFELASSFQVRRNGTNQFLHTE